MKQIIKLLNKPCIIGIIADVNEGKSMFLYDLIENLKQNFKFSLYTFGLRVKLANSQEINSVEELEEIKNSIVVVDEFFSIFDLENRKKKNLIENTLRMIFHNNNILILSGLPENFKKFISAKLNVVVFKKCTLSDFINGSRVKNICLSYKGKELGSAIINLAIDEALIFDGKHYSKEKIEYYRKYDTKLKNKPILCKNIVRKNYAKSVPKNVLKV